jgi:hypothetical protein
MKRDCSFNSLLENGSILRTDVKSAAWRFKRMENYEEGIEVEKNVKRI